ncbi:GMC oxidoreductase-domain-containing protein [Flammula alnicola]|nr:GMC oxidoreductase-domain-containing protein [Flammula alnicola]
MSDAPLSQNEYDIIFAGGGTAGCVTAGRLAKADPSLKILVLEAGPHTKDMIDHIQPGRYIRHIAPGSNTTTLHVSKPSDAVGGRNIFVHTARCVGGGSAVNWLMYNRASASDYDDWETEHNNPGWGSKEIISLLRKAETYQVNPDLPTHGYSGPLKVSLGGHYDLSAQQFVEFGPKVEKDRSYSKEYNSMHADSLNVFALISISQRVPKWIDEKTGKRQDAAHNFIYNQPENKNLEVLDGCRVKRVIFENKRAVGIEFFNDKFIRPNADPVARTVRASRLIVISAGTLGSSAILERSGIGAAERLKKIGIPQIVDLPGVGENYQDHLLVGAAYFVDPIVDTYDALVRGDPDETKKQLDMWTKDGTGLLGSNGVDAGIKLRPREDELHELGPEFQSRWRDFFHNKPDKPILWMKGSPRLPATDLSKQLGIPPTKFMTGGYFPAYPACRGSVHIISDDVYAPLDFDTGFMTELSDIAILRWAYKRSREIMRRLPVYRGPVPQSHPQFPEGSNAITTTETSPVDIHAPKITYDADDDAAIDHYHRHTVATAWHSMGTCAMKPRERGGVVDPKLNVYGVEGLKIADVSIPPSNVNANTYSTAIAIGEKAALLIAHELDIHWF